jgi:Flp pilus assembly protein TadG
MRCSKQRRWRSQRGQAMIETGLMIIVMATVSFFIFELGGLLYTYSVMANAANEGVRYAIVRSGAGDADGTTKARVKNFATTSMHDVSAMSVSVSAPDGSYTPPNRVRVTVSYVYVPYLPKFMNAPTMTAYAEGRMVTQ